MAEEQGFAALANGAVRQKLEYVMRALAGPDLSISRTHSLLEAIEATRISLDDEVNPIELVAHSEVVDALSEDEKLVVAAPLLGGQLISAPSAWLHQHTLTLRSAPDGMVWYTRATCRPAGTWLATRLRSRC